MERWGKILMLCGLLVLIGGAALGLVAFRTPDFDLKDILIWPSILGFAAGWVLLVWGFELYSRK
jgi:hypothetical protein